MKSVIAFAVFFCGAAAFAGPEGHAPAQMPKEFDLLKSLVGTWEGTNTMDGKEMTSTVSYELTSGGTAVAERLGVGTPHEMLTVYHKEGKSLGVTHYRAIGNSAKMHLKKAETNMLAFEMAKPEGISSMKEMHMHAVSLKLDGDTLTQVWENYDKGKKADSLTLVFKRKK